MPPAQNESSQSISRPHVLIADTQGVLIFKFRGKQFIMLVLIMRIFFTVSSN
ncbi:hypothetical protein DSUL_60058 [Desulfovibrionales bacterium]